MTPEPTPTPLASFTALAALGLVGLLACASQTPTAGSYTPTFVAEAPESDVALAESSASAPMEPHRRQSLGTRYGEQRESRITSVPFDRGTEQPDAVLGLYYDDLEAVRELSRRHDVQPAAAEVASADGRFRLALVDETGRVLGAADVGGSRHAIGAIGLRYQIGIENHSGHRYEVVASVDGLDVIDGEEAGFDKRGYVLDAYSSLMLEGFRTSEVSVAAFRFGTREDSYAERMGRGRNVGVVGAAFFHERGVQEPADPFPRRFAPPPPVR